MSSNRKEQVYRFIVEYKKTHDGNSPTYDEIGEGCGITTSSLVNYYLQELEIEKRIKRDGVRAIDVGGTWTKE